MKRKATGTLGKSKPWWVPRTPDERRLVCRAAQFVVDERQCGLKSLMRKLGVGRALADNIQGRLEELAVIDVPRGGPGRRKVLVPDLKALARDRPQLAVNVDDGNHSPTPPRSPPPPAPELPTEADVGPPSQPMVRPGTTPQDLEGLCGKLRQLLAAQHLMFGDTRGVGIIRQTILTLQKLIEERGR